VSSALIVTSEELMPLTTYGILKGTVIGHLRDADDDHYQIQVKAGNTVHRIASNVKSSAPKSPSTVLFQSITVLPNPLIRDLQALDPGYRKLVSKPGGLALDYVRSGLVKPSSMKPVPPDAPGVDNDLKDLLEAAVVKAMKEAGSVIYALGAKWGPEKNRPDQYFRFLPGNGIHDIHMNQGNSGKYKKDNGTYQDGALIIEYPGSKWRAFFFAFQSQTFKTDDRGNPVGAGALPKSHEPAKKTKKAKSTKRGTASTRASRKKAVSKKREE
jgi:uncharacterized protein YukJ